MQRERREGGSDGGEGRGREKRRMQQSEECGQVQDGWG